MDWEVSTPLKTLKFDAGFMCIFRRIGCIGDSLASGEFEYDKGNDVTGYWDYYDYSWGKQIERFTGIEMTNFSMGGMTAYMLLKHADEKSCPVKAINHLFNKEYAQQAYIIALGVNDLSAGAFHSLYGGQLGDPKKDIDLTDHNKNAATFAGYYAKIIQRLQEIQPEAKFFLMTIPSDSGSEEFAQLIYDIAKVLKNCYVIDLYHHAPRYDEDFKDKYFCGGHMNAMGYLMTAYYIMTYIDYIIRENLHDFKNVPFIGSDYKPKL